MKVLRAFGSLVLLSILLLGVPAILLAWGDPLSLLSVDWSSALRRPDDGTVLLGILSLLGWIAWLVLLVTSVVETAETISRGRIYVSLPGIGWLRPLIGSLVATALAPFLTLGTDAHPHPVSTLPAATALPLTPEPEEILHTSDETPHSPSPRSPSQQVSSTVDHVVGDGDELWSLAEIHLGSGDRWREITAVNPGISAASDLIPGSVLKIPVTPDETDVVEVTPGDTLWHLADKHLDDPLRWPEIHEENRDKITDPDHIEPGWTLSLPTDPASTAPSGESAHLDAGYADPTPLEPRPQGAESGSSDDEPLHSEESADHTDGGTGETNDDDHDPSAGVAEILGPIGGVLAAGLFAGIAARRRMQLLNRAVGSRLVPYAPQLRRFVSALGRTGQQVDEEMQSLSPTSVMMGWVDDEPFHLDLEGAGLTVVSGEPELSQGLAAGVITGLMCSPWSTSVTVTTVQPDQSWHTALDDPRLTSHSELAEALTELQRRVARRRIALRDATLTQVRHDPDRSEAYAPYVMVFCRPLEAAHLQRIRDCLALGDVGVSVVATVRRSTSTTDTETSVTVMDEETAALAGSSFTPQLLTLPARRAIVDLFAAALDPSSEPAPWWQDDLLPANISVLPRRRAHQDQEEPMPPWNDSPDSPTLLILGEVDLIGCRGRRPSRAVSQCMEYCAWLLENPSATPTAMANDLLVAEATRRSNMSRLRTWLGSDPDNEPYLPDAYSGRIDLSGDVTSDWEHFQLLLSGGVNNANDASLRAALAMVRGEPLHLVGFQWPWAEQLRTDMLSMITDATVVLADRYLETGDVDGARWALSQGIRAVGDDETLAARDITALSLLGDRAGVDRAVRKLTRAARADGRDISAETARRIQHALHTVLTADGRSS